MMPRAIAATIGFLLLTLCVSCSSDSTPVPDQVTGELAMLAGWMTGSFSSQAQANADSNFYDIRLEMVPIWTDRADRPWLYVEQASAAALDRPYRQRVYHLMQVDDSTYRSDVYTCAEPLRFAGAWSRERPLGALGPDSLELRDGCSITLRPVGADAFEGSTMGQGCESTLRGAQYATSEVRITATKIYSWDRGFDSTDTQVWGAETGGYSFQKQPLQP